MDKITKICNKCRIEKNLDEFWDRKDAIDGKFKTCIECKTKIAIKEGKICTKCKLYKIIDEFNNDNRARDGKHCWCKLCVKNYRLENKKQIKNYQKEWILKNIEHIREYDRQRRNKNIEKQKEIWRQKYYNDKEFKERELKLKRESYHRNKHKNKEDKKIKASKALLKYNEKSAPFSLGYKITPVEEIRKDPVNIDLLQVRCTYCNKWFNPTMKQLKNRSNHINNTEKSERKFYCDKICKKLCPIHHASEKSYLLRFSPMYVNYNLSREVQAELRKMVFERDNWKCLKCGDIKNLHCHHYDPVIHNDIESADINNCGTYCAKCHIAIHKEQWCKDLIYCKKNRENNLPKKLF